MKLKTLRFLSGRPCRRYIRETTAKRNQTYEKRRYGKVEPSGVLCSDVDH